MRYRLYMAGEMAGGFETVDAAKADAAGRLEPNTIEWTRAENPWIGHMRDFEIEIRDMNSLRTA